MPGFGQIPASRRGTEVHFAPPFPVAGPLLAPSPAWTGEAASGFSSSPSDPERTTAKPAARLLVPPGQFYKKKLNVGVAAAANDGGTLIGGIDRVRFRYEGATVDVLEPSAFTFPDSNGNEVTYWGYWVTLSKLPGTVGEAQLYAEVVPADATMQARVIGPYSFFPAKKLHDAEYTVDPDDAVSSTNFHSFDDALAQVKSDAAANPRVTFKKAMNNVAMSFIPPTFTPSGYVTVEAKAPVTFGRTALTTTASVDSDSNLRPRLNGLWLKGGNITVDYAYVDNLYSEGGKEFVLDGITMTNSRGPNALWRGGPYWTGSRVRNSPYFLEVSASNLENIAVAASLVRGGVFANLSRDIFADVRCLVGTRVETHDDTPFNDDAPAFTVHYTGTQSTATIARSGTVDPNNATYTFKWGGNSASFTVGKQPADYAGTDADGYLFAEVVDFINTVLASQDSGWSATLNDTQGRRASSGSLAGLKAQGFGDTNCKSAPLDIVSSFDAHGDWYQQRFNTISENVIAYDNVAYDMQSQNIFISSTSDAKDFVFFNNALGNDPVGSDYFCETSVFSQIGRSGTATTISHVVIAHCSMPNQTLSFRNDGVPSTFDSYCLVANNALRGLVKNGTAPIDAKITGNHLLAGSNPLAEAVATTTGGSATDLFADFTIGDFLPAGALLSNLKVPVVTRNQAGVQRLPVAPAGAI